MLQVNHIIQVFHKIPSGSDNQANHKISDIMKIYYSKNIS